VEQLRSVPSELEQVELLTGYLLEASPEKVADTVKSLATWPEAERDPLLPFALIALAEADAEQAVRVWISLPSEARNRTATYHFIRVLAENDHQQALGALPPTGDARLFAANTLLGAMAAEDPLLAWHWIEKHGWKKLPAAVPVLEELARYDPAGAMQKADQLEDPRWQASARLAVFARWFEAQPATAKKWLREQDEALRRNALGQLLRNAYQENGREGFEAMAAQFEAPADMPLIAEQRQSMMRGLPSEVLWELAEAGQWQELPPERIHGMVEHALNQSAPDVSAVLSRIPASMVRDLEAAQRVVTEWTLLDPTAARQWAEALPDGELREAAILRVSTMLIEKDPALAFAQFEETGKGALRERMAYNIALGMRRRDADSAAAWLRTLPLGIDRIKALEGFTHGAVDEDAAGVASGLLSLGNDPDVAKALAGFMRQFSQEDPLLAMEWSLSQPMTESMREQLVSQLRDNLCREYPEGAISLAQGMESGPLRDRLIYSLAFQARDLELMAPIRELIDSMDEGSEKAKALTKLLELGTRHDPVGTAAALMRGEFGTVEESMLQAVADGWAEYDPAGSAAWIGEQMMQSGKRPGDFDRATQVIAREWARQDPETALTWAEALPPGIRKQTVMEVARGMLKFDPARAWEVASSVRDRAGQLEYYAKEYYKAMPERAVRDIQNSALPEEVKQSLIEEL